VVPNSKYRIIHNTLGSFADITSRNGRVQGELIAVTDDTVYVLTEITLVKILTDELLHMQIQLTRNNAQNYNSMMLVGFTPMVIGMVANSEYVGPFAALGAITALFSGSAILGEKIRDPHLILYPEQVNNLDELRKYARFPLGVKPDILRWEMLSD